jgi:hypothetical protein
MDIKGIFVKGRKERVTGLGVLRHAGRDADGRPVALRKGQPASARLWRDKPAFAALPPPQSYGETGRRGKSHLVKVWCATQIRACRAEALAKAGSPKLAWNRLTERMLNEN